MCALGIDTSNGQKQADQSKLTRTLEGDAPRSLPNVRWCASQFSKGKSGLSAGCRIRHRVSARGASGDRLSQMDAECAMLAAKGETFEGCAYDPPAGWLNPARRRFRRRPTSVRRSHRTHAPDSACWSSRAADKICTHVTI